MFDPPDRVQPAEPAEPAEPADPPDAEEPQGPAEPADVPATGAGSWKSSPSFSRKGEGDGGRWREMI